MADVLLRAELARAGLEQRVRVQSAGTGDWHLGEPMDRGARAELARHGLDGSAHRARQIGPDWLDRFDLLLATDRSNLRNLERMANGQPGRRGATPSDPRLAGRIRLLRSFDPQAPDGAEVPDPYGGGQAEFGKAYNLIEAAVRGLVGELTELLSGVASD
jgi:protein-tyrosine phosphatase